MRRLLSLEGNIGSGKSTLLARLRRRLGSFHAIDEPLAKWRGSNGEEAQRGPNLLQLFYDSPERWAFTFQTAAFLTRAQAMQAAMQARDDGADAGGGTKTWLTERSLQSDRQIFAANGYAHGLLTDAEWAVYDEYHRWIVNEFADMQIDGAIYLRASPDTCMSRIRKRGRKEEDGIQVSYLEQLHARHEEWLVPRGKDIPMGRSFQRSISSDGIPVLVLDASDIVIDVDGTDSMEEAQERKAQAWEAAVDHFASDLVRRD
jgi:deoxyadenosine/deoxycytidine kinase